MADASGGRSNAEQAKTLDSDSIQEIELAVNAEIERATTIVGAGTPAMSPP
jgi:hypothetical protein